MIMMMPCALDRLGASVHVVFCENCINFSLFFVLNFISFFFLLLEVLLLSLCAFDCVYVYCIAMATAYCVSCYVNEWLTDCNQG